MKGLTLTEREQNRLQILNLMVEGQLGAMESANLMGLSERHTWRLLSAYRKEGAAALTHGNRGRRPSNRTAEATRELVINLDNAEAIGLEIDESVLQRAERLIRKGKSETKVSD